MPYRSFAACASTPAPVNIVELVCVNATSNRARTACRVEPTTPSDFGTHTGKVSLFLSDILGPNIVSK